MRVFLVKKIVNKLFSSDVKHFVAVQVVATVVFASAASYMFHSFYQLSREDAETIGVRTVYEVSERIKGFLVQGTESLFVMSETVDFLLKNDESDDVIERYFSAASNNDSSESIHNFAGVYGWIRGRYVDGANQKDVVNFVPKAQDWYIDALRSQGNVAIIPPYDSSRTNKSVLSMSRLLSDYSSVVSVDLALDGLQEYVDSLSLSGEGFGFIIDKNSLILAHADSRQRGKIALRDASLSEGFSELVGSILSTNATRFKTKLGGEDVVAFSNRILDDWTVVLVLPKHAILKRMQVSVGRIMLLFLLVIAFLFFQLTQAFRRRLELEKQVWEQTEKIREQSKLMLDMQTNIIEELATLIEARDANTGEHVKNTKVYSIMIAEKLYVKKLYSDEVDKKFISDLGAAAPLHDIGKITIPDSVLLKRGKLTDFEYETMKNHTRFGGAIIRRIFNNVVDRQAVQMAIDVALYHHERWDGRGYPLNIKGEEIPLAARILAVADCFDALVSERCYKPALPRDEAFKLICEEAGTHFDPLLVEIFLSLRPKIEKHLDKKASRVTE